LFVHYLKEALIMSWRTLHSRKPSPPVPRKSCPLKLEQLEDRCLPAPVASYPPAAIFLFNSQTIAAGVLNQTLLQNVDIKAVANNAQARMAIRALAVTDQVLQLSLANGANLPNNPVAQQVLLNLANQLQTLETIKSDVLANLTAQEVAVFQQFIDAVNRNDQAARSAALQRIVELETGKKAVVEIINGLEVPVVTGIAFIDQTLAGVKSKAIEFAADDQKLINDLDAQAGGAQPPPPGSPPSSSNACLGTFTGTANATLLGGFPPTEQLSGQIIQVTIASITNGRATGTVDIRPFGGRPFFGAFTAPITDSGGGTCRLSPTVNPSVSFEATTISNNHLRGTLNVKDNSGHSATFGSSLGPIDLVKGG
jgi:hypothetical protein